METENNTNNENKANNENMKEVKFKKGFFKKVWYSIFKLEKYGEMSAEGVGRAITYLVKLSLIIAITICFGTLYQLNGIVKKGVTFLEEQVGDFSYKDGILQLEEDKVVVAPSSMFGTVIIDTNTESNDQVNEYLKSIKTDKGVLILKNQVIVKGVSSNGLLDYNYKNMLTESGITELNKEQTIQYLQGSESWKVYGLIFVLLLGYTLINAFLPVLFDAFLLSLFGFIATFFAKIKMRYAAIFNLAAYAMTLSIILHAVYIIVNIFTSFTIKYFQIMYVGVATIYLIAAIFLIKSEFIKMQIEMTKENQKKNEEERQKELEEPEEDKKEEEPEKKEEPEEKKKKDTNNGAEPEGV